MTALAEAYYRRLYAFHDDSPVIPLEEFYNPNHDPKDGRFTNGPSGKIGTGGKGGKVWTGVSADPDNRVRPKSKVHFPIEPDDFETQGEARARFGSSIYDADLGDGYQARVTNVRVIPNGISVFIKIRKGHEEVGEASRELTIAEDGRLIAHHETLYIAGKHQGLGIADRFNAHAVAEYQRLGVDHIDLHAGASVGGYAWARQGYRIFEGDRKKFLNAQLDRLETQLNIPALRPHAERLRTDAAVLRKAIEAGEDVQPIHLASLGEKYARHTARDDHRREYPTWPGKSLLIGTTWFGQYYFDANRAVTAAATDLEHAALRPAFHTEGIEEFYNHVHDTNTGRFASGGGRRMYNDHGSWGNSWQGSSTITGQSAEIMGISGYFAGGHPARMDERFGHPGLNDETRKAQIRDAHDHAVQLLGAIHDATPFNKPLYSGIALGAERFASLRPGDHIALPTTATSYDREFAHESGARPYEPGDMFKAETGIKSDVPVVLKFEAGTKAVKYQHNFREMITAGHFEVVSVDRVKSPYELFRRELNDLPVANAIEITLRQTHTIDPSQPITASGEWDDFACHDASCRPPTSGGTGGSLAKGEAPGAGPRAPKQAHLSRDETRVAPNTTAFGMRINAMLDKDPNLRDLSKKTIDAAHEKRLAGQRAIDEDELVRTYTVGTPLIESSHTYRGRWWLDQPGNKEQGERENAAIDEMASALARVKQIRQEDYEPQNDSERILQNALDTRLHHDLYEPLIVNGEFGQIVLRGARVRNLQKDVVVDGVMEQAVIRVGHEVRIEIRDRVAKLDVDAVETHHIDTMSKINALAKEVYGDEAQVSISRFRSDTEANINVSGPAEKEGRFRQNLDKDHPAMVKIRALVNDSGINTHRQADHVANFQNREHQRITHEVLSEITQLGGRLDGTPKNVKNRWGSINSHDQVVAAVKNYPDSWIGASNASTTLKFRQTSGRAHYQHSKNDGKSEITLDGSIATAVHEFAHRFERTVPGVLGLEARFHDRRTAGEKEVKMGAGYGRNEVTKPDQFFERYAGKTYHGNAYELMSMGYEHLRSSTGWGRVDDEYKAFVLGTLVSAYRG